MTDTRHTVEHIDAAFAEIRTRLGATIRQLREWSGEFPATTHGAPPSSAPARTDGDDNPVRLTKVEADALVPDAARLTLERIDVLVDLIVDRAGTLGDSLPGDRLPPPDPRLPARLAFVQWQINKIARSRLPRTATGNADALWRPVKELATICANNQPPDRNQRPTVGGCIAHARIESWVEIDNRYRKHELCQPCGRFKHDFGQIPPPGLVREAEKSGWRHARASSTLRRFGIVARRPAS